MLWAIDVGNTQTVVGIYFDGDWRCLWRLKTDHFQTEDELAASLSALCELDAIEFRADEMIIGSVVPGVNETWSRFCFKWLGFDPTFLTKGEEVGLTVLYNPPHAVGADRIANTLGGLAVAEPPLIILDFGTATTFDVISPEGHYLGGVIMPGVNVSMRALTSSTAKLPQIELAAPDTVIGMTTSAALQSGLVLGHAAAVDALAAKIKRELGEPATVLATGGVGKALQDICTCIDRYDENLTLDGLRLAAQLLSK
ncbi:MAG: type III pantothenate kinase [Chthonomonas sp.]|nr:type III pantothenate kinase [Chthonomonas sp.]